jgi:hypothetical protein
VYEIAAANGSATDDTRVAVERLYLDADKGGTVAANGSAADDTRVAVELLCLGADKGETEELGGKTYASVTMPTTSHTDCLGRETVRSW